MFKMDFWYPDKRDIASCNCFFCDCDVIYRGNVYDAKGRAIGDYVSDDSVAIEKYFKNIGLEMIWH